MTAPLLTPDAAARVSAAAASAGGVIATAAGADVDEAFDAAVSAAYEQPTAGVSLTSADPGSLEYTDQLHSLDEAVGAALAWLTSATLDSTDGDGNPGASGEEPRAGQVAAFAVVARSGHTRVTRRARLDGVDLVVDSSPASTWSPPDATVIAALAEADAGPVDGENLETFTYTRRARYKPQVTVHKAKSAGEFVVLDGDRIVSRGHRTAGDARRAAVNAMKELAKDNHATPRWEVYKLSGREGGLPLLEVVRARVAQVLSVKAVYAKVKPAARAPKVVGWVFAYRPGVTD